MNWISLRFSLINQVFNQSSTQAHCPSAQSATNWSENRNSRRCRQSKESSSVCAPRHQTDTQLRPCQVQANLWGQRANERFSGPTVSKGSWEIRIKLYPDTFIISQNKTNLPKCLLSTLWVTSHVGTVRWFSEALKGSSLHLWALPLFRDVDFYIYTCYLLLISRCFL